MDFLQRAQSGKQELIDWRRTLHRDPETGFDLPHTTAFVRGKLAEFGIEARAVGRAGLSAVLGQSGGRCILLRADMDALPLREETGLPFASDNGRMHACGHDFHTASLLGAARLLRECEQAGELPGRVILMFQPAEEIMSGARDMLDAGLLDGGVPDAALALHVAKEPLNSAGIRHGFTASSCDIFRITLHGVGTHGASPQNGTDPINAAAHLITALQVLNSRETAPGDPLVLTVCSIHGGTTHNILPETCELSGTIRAAAPAVREQAKQRLAEIADGVAGTFRLRAEVEFVDGIPPVINDEALADRFCRYADELLGAGSAWEISPLGGSEDFSYLGELCPSVLLMYGVGNAAEGFPHPIHNPGVLFNEEALPGMTAVYASFAWRFLRDET